MVKPLNKSVKHAVSMKSTQLGKKKVNSLDLFSLGIRLDVNNLIKRVCLGIDIKLC